MKPEPIHAIVARLKRLHLSQRILELRRLVSLEKPYSVRRNELQSLLEGTMERQIKIEIRKGGRHSAEHQSRRHGSAH